MNVYYTEYQSMLGIIYIAATENGICSISLPGSKKEEFIGWLKKHYDNIIEEESNLLVQGIAELDEYFKGVRKEFSIPLDLQGTDFQKKVWEALCKVPCGSTATYGEIACMIGNPKASRAVGGANNKNPVPIIVPCHRIIGSNGKLVGYAGGVDMKQRLLEIEKS